MSDTLESFRDKWEQNKRLAFEETITEGSDILNWILDWYHPRMASRHTVIEVRGWFERAGLKIVHEHVDLYEIAMRGRGV
jgi:hypothetical protein